MTKLADTYIHLRIDDFSKSVSSQIFGQPTEVYVRTESGSLKRPHERGEHANWRPGVNGCAEREDGQGW